MMTEVTDASNVTAENDDQCVVYLVDDNEMFRESLVYLLESVDLRVIAFSSPDAFLAEFVPERAGCILLDIRMPGLSGIDLHEKLVERGVRAPVIIITGHGEVETAVRALTNGAAGYIEKSDSQQEVIDRVQSALRDDADRRSRERSLDLMLQRFLRLTPREREILAQVATGRSSRQISEHLQELKQKTVEAHRARIMRKMDAPNVAGLMRMYLQLRAAGLVTDELEELQGDSPGTE